MDTVKAALEGLGYTCEYYSFSDSNDLSSIVTKAASESDVLYLPTDNTVAAATGIVDNICRPTKIPVVAGEEGICAGCGVAIDIHTEYPFSIIIMQTAPPVHIVPSTVKSAKSNIR